MLVTLTYALNMTGVSIRFLSHAERARSKYARNCEIMATFQALSWHEEGSMDLLDPFSTRNDQVSKQRRRLRDADIEPLNLENQAESQMWQRLRELVIVDLKE